jgi:hypothetical protein
MVGLVQAAARQTGAQDAPMLLLRDPRRARAADRPCAGRSAIVQAGLVPQLVDLL